MGWKPDLRQLANAATLARKENLLAIGGSHHILGTQLYPPIERAKDFFLEIGHLPQPYVYWQAWEKWSQQKGKNYNQYFVTWASFSWNRTEENASRNLEMLHFSCNKTNYSSRQKYISIKPCRINGATKREKKEASHTHTIHFLDLWEREKERQERIEPHCL